MGKELRKRKVIKIRALENALEKPGYTYFIGYKRKGEKEKAFCIFYPTASMREGRPDAVIWVEGADNLLNILHGHFQEKWEQAVKNSG